MLAESSAISKAKDKVGGVVKGVLHEAGDILKSKAAQKVAEVVIKAASKAGK